MQAKVITAKLAEAHHKSLDHAEPKAHLLLASPHQRSVKLLQLVVERMMSQLSSRTCIKQERRVENLDDNSATPHAHNKSYLFRAESRPSVNDLEGEVLSICGGLCAYRDAPLAGVLECIRHHTMHHLGGAKASNRLLIKTS